MFIHVHVCTCIKTIRNEMGCRGDTMSKSVDTRRHCKKEQQSFATSKNQDVGIGLQKIVACYSYKSKYMLDESSFNCHSFEPIVHDLT